MPIFERIRDRLDDARAEREYRAEVAKQEAEMLKEERRTRRANPEQAARARVAEARLIQQYGLKKTQTPGRYRLPNGDRAIDIDFTDHESVRTGIDALDAERTSSEPKTRIRTAPPEPPARRSSLAAGAGIIQNLANNAAKVDFGGGFGGGGTDLFSLPKQNAPSQKGSQGRRQDPFSLNMPSLGFPDGGGTDLFSLPKQNAPSQKGSQGRRQDPFPLNISSLGGGGNDFFSLPGQVQRPKKKQTKN